MNTFAVLGIAIFIGILCGRLFDKIGIPEVVGIVLVGIILGESGLGILRAERLEYFKPLVDLALAFFGFFIGAELKIFKLRQLGKVILLILISEVIFTFMIVLLGLYIYLNDLYIALLLATLAISTAPAATADVIWEYKASGELTTTILALVGFDDVATILVYSITSNYILNILGEVEFTIIHALGFFLSHVGFAVLIGLGFGGVLIGFTRLFKRMREIFITAIGIVILASGVAELVNASEIVSTLILGLIFSNYCGKADKAVGVVRDLSEPIFTIFFVLIGSHLNIYLIPTVAAVALAYIFTSILGKFSGATLGAYLSNADTKIRKNIGFTLYSQAGITLGLSHQLLYDLKEVGLIGYQIGLKIINILLSATLILLIIGPVMVKYALYRAGELYKEKIESIDRIPLR